MNKCAVLIPHYNDSAGLNESLQSITPDERLCVFVVDDGSNIKPDEMKAREVYRGELNFIYLPSNQGIDHALNAGLERIGEAYAFRSETGCKKAECRAATILSVRTNENLCKRGTFM